MAMNYWDSIKIDPMMSLDLFWRRIEDAQIVAQSQDIRMHQALSLRLSLDTVEEIDLFQERFRELHRDAEREDIYKVIGGTDDDFTDSINSVISQGRAVYEKLLKNPRSFDEDIWEYEVFGYAYDEAREEPARGKLRIKALATLEASMLDAALGRSTPSTPAPRL